MKHKKFFLIGAVLILVAVLGAMVYWMFKFSSGAPMPLLENETALEQPSRQETIGTNGSSEGAERESLGGPIEKGKADPDPKAPWKNYFNSEIGISFSYPSTMEIIFDGPVETDNPEEAEAGEEGYFWHRIVLKDSESFEQPELVLEIDADEIDLVSFDKEYDVAETEDGRVEILSLDDGAVVSESSKNDGMTILSTLPIDSINEVSYAPRFSFKEGGRDLSSDFQLILKSMKFFELSE